jgi:hypothetical protein
MQFRTRTLDKEFSHASVHSMTEQCLSGFALTADDGVH